MLKCNLRCTGGCIANGISSGNWTEASFQGVFQHFKKSVPTALTRSGARHNYRERKWRMAQACDSISVTIDVVIAAFHQNRDYSKVPFLFSIVFHWTRKTLKLSDFFSLKTEMKSWSTNAPNASTLKEIHHGRFRHSCFKKVKGKKNVKVSIYRCCRNNKDE